MAKQNEQLAALAAEGLKEVADEFADDLERRPTSAELFEILTLALQSADEETLSDTDPSNVVALRPTLKKGAARADPSTEDVTDSAVAELNDAAFVAAGEMIGQLAEGVREDEGDAPTLAELCNLLVEGLHRCDDDLLGDVKPAEVAGVKREVRKMKKIKPKVGDVVAIPASNGEHFHAVVLARNVFGTAFGLFEGTGGGKPVSAESHPPVVARPVYADDHAIETGRWKIVGHDEGLLKLFPSEPEIYHGPNEDNPDLGPHGAGETASGKLRQLTREEAEEIGLLSGAYRQSYMSETLEEKLDSQSK